MTIKLIYTPTDAGNTPSIEKLELTLDSEILDSTSFTQAINKLLTFMGCKFILYEESVILDKAKELEKLRREIQEDAERRGFL